MTILIISEDNEFQERANTYTLLSQELEILGVQIAPSVEVAKDLLFSGEQGEKIRERFGRDIEIVYKTALDIKMMKSNDF